MAEIKLTRGDFAPVFGGVGFHNSEANLYRLIEKEQFDQKICKCYRECAPGFMRTFAGYPNWTKDNMDAFADYYERMQKWTETPMYFACAKGQLHFNDGERAEYAENVAKRLDYLINERNVRQLRYYCYSNELSMNDWGGLYNEMPLFQKYHELLFQAFQRHNLNIGLLATDASPIKRWDSLDYAAKHMNRITEDFCAHHYVTEYELDDPAFYPWFTEQCREAVMKAIRCDGKRFILGEFGLKNVAGNVAGLVRLPGVINDTPGYNANGKAAFAALMLSEGVLAAINAGSFAVVLWTFVDYPDPYVCHYAEHDPYAIEWGKAEPFISQTQDVKYNKWGMIKWEEDGDYGVRPQFYALGLLTRYLRRNSKVLDVACDDPLVRVCGVLNRDGSVSVVLVNRHTEETEIALKPAVAHIEKQPPFRVYEYDSACPPENEFGDLPDPVAVLPLTDGKLCCTLRPLSVTVLTTDYLDLPDVPMENVVRNGHLLTWNASRDENHCYYRVYRGESPDFIPSRANQIASTVAETLDFSARYLDDAAIIRISGDYYKVLSVRRKR